MTVAKTEVIVQEDNNVKVFSWAFGTTATDDGVPVTHPQYADCTWQVTGTFGGATVAIKGSNLGTTYSTMQAVHDGAALTFAAAGIKHCIESPRHLRPEISGATGTTDLIVSVTMRKLPKVSR